MADARGRIVGGVATLVAAGAVTAGFVLTSATGDEAGAAPDDTTPPQLVAVERRDLRRTESFDGTTGHGVAWPLVLAGSGTVTELPAAGTVVDQGSMLIGVDGRPVIVLLGALPMWRALDPSVDDGADVRQLESALAALGYAATHDVTVDDDWTGATTRAVKAFQGDHGLDDDGTLDVGDIVWIPAPVRVDSVAGAVGQQVADAGIEVTGTAQVVHLDLDVADADLAPVGTEVRVELPTGETIAATVTSVGAAVTGDDGSSTLPIDVALAAAASVLDGLPVDVTVTTVAADDVLAAPVESLLALAGGGYALEVAGADGTTHLVKVELGVFADDMIAVSGEIEAGDEVVVP